MKWIIQVLTMVLVLASPQGGGVAGGQFDVEIIPAVFTANYVGIVVSYHSPEPADLLLRFVIPRTGRIMDCLFRFENEDPSTIAYKDFRVVRNPDGSATSISLTYRVVKIGVWNAWIIFPREQVVHLPDISQIAVHALVVKSGSRDGDLFIHIAKSRMVAIGEILLAPEWQSAGRAEMLKQIGKWHKIKQGI